MQRPQPLPQELIELHEKVRKAVQDYGLDTFEVVFEMLDYDQINAVAAGGGFPTRYPHWRFGMDYDQLSKGYEWGMQKIYEMVINTDPCYAYLLNSNPMIDQKLVMTHVYGHCDFFKNNFWFSKTNRKMMDQMANHAVRVRRYMDAHGVEAVEAFIDTCLSVEELIDPYLPFVEAKENIPQEKSSEDGRLKSSRPYLESFINPKEFVESQKKKIEEKKKEQKRFPSEPTRDILKFVLDHSPLEDWQADILSIIRDEAYYFAPQRMTKIMNEGWASYWHSKIMTEKLLGAAEIVDFADRHAGVMATNPGRLNPYKLGIELFRHIEERWNKGQFGKDWDNCDDMVAKRSWDRKLGLGREKIFSLRKTHNDVTFVDEFFTEEFCEEQKLYTYELNPRTKRYEIKTRDWREVKEQILSGITNAGNPVIKVVDGNFRNRGELLLKHDHHGQDLDLNYARATLTNLVQLWRRPVNIETLLEGTRKILAVNEKGEFTEEKA